MAFLEAEDPSRFLDRKAMIRADLTAGNRTDDRHFDNFANAGISEIKCSNPEDILIIGRIGRTREMVKPEPEMDLVRLKIVGMDAIDRAQTKEENDEDSEDDIEIDDGEERLSLNAQREAVLETLLVEFELLDEKKLCFLPNKLVFRLNITFHILQDDGCVLDTSMLSLIAALQRLRYPRLKYLEEEDVVDFDWNDLCPPETPVVSEVTSTFALIGSKFLASPTAEEESVADAVVLVVLKDDGRIAFAHVLDGSLAPNGSPFSFEPILSLAVGRRTQLKEILVQPPTEDVLIPEDRVTRLRSFNVGG